MPETQCTYCMKTVSQCYHNMNIQVAYFEFLMHHQQRPVFAPSFMYVTCIFFFLRQLVDYPALD